MDNKPDKTSNNTRRSENEQNDQSSGEENFQDRRGEVTAEMENGSGGYPIQESRIEEFNFSPYIPEEL